MDHLFKHNALALMAAALAVAIAPPLAITPSAWAAQNMVVADGPNRGERFDAGLTPYFCEILDFFSEDCPDNKAVLRKSKQIGASTLAIAAVGYTVAVEPCDLFLIEPTDSSLSEFIALKLQPTIDATPALRDRVNRQTARSGRGSTTFIKRFPGGNLLMGIATSTADLRGKTRKKVIEDEASEYDDDLGGQGSPHVMIAGAYETYRAQGTWKHLLISTPVIKGACYIDAAFEAGDQRYWYVPCPGCGAEFVFKRDPKEFRYSETYPYGAHYVAPCCGAVIEHHQKNALVRQGRWIALAPAPGKYRSYHFDTLSSPFVPWDDIAERCVEAKDDPAKLKALDTLTFGVAHEVRGDAPDHVRLMALRESYDRRRIPPRGLLLVASADVQANGIYVEVVAFAPDRQSWVVEALVLGGDTSDPEGGAFALLTEVYETAWPDSFGGKRRVDAFGVDSGFRSHVVYAWSRGRPNAFALDGVDGWSRAPLGTPRLVDIDLGGRKIKQGATLWPVGTWSLKAQLYADLRKLRLQEGAEIEPPGALHFGSWMDENYFIQLTNEHLADVPFKGRSRRKWKEHGPNHFLDCRVYNLALADYLGLTRMTQDEWAMLARERAAPMVEANNFFAPRPLQVQAAQAVLAPEVVSVAAAEPPRGAAPWLSRRTNWLRGR